jgi:hypothetical protein
LTGDVIDQDIIMGKHENGYGRIERDYYPTPAWVIEALTEHIDIKGLHILEPACGDGRMAEALKGAGAEVYATDIEDRGYEHLDGLVDFTRSAQLEFQLDARFNGAAEDFDAVVTNPPLGHRGQLGVSFIEIGLVQMNSGFMAMLLPADFDSAKTRRGLFGHCSKFVGKIILTRRIKWFDMPGKNKSPKENSAWFLWGKVPWRTSSKSTIRYAPKSQ